MALYKYLRMHGRSNNKVKTHLRSVGVDTFKLTRISWLKLLLFIQLKREFSAITDMDLVPEHTMAYWLLDFAEETFLAH